MLNITKENIMLLFDPKIKNHILTSKQIAHDFNVSEKTINRYMEKYIPSAKTDKGYITTVECFQWYVATTSINEAMKTFLRSRGVDVEAIIGIPKDK